MKHNPKKLYEDIIEAIIEIEDFEKGILSIEDFKSQIMAKKAIERNFTIIGEACTRLKALNITLENALKIIAFRNYIVHEYDKLDNETIYVILKRHLPKLKIEVQNLLNE